MSRALDLRRGGAALCAGRDARRRSRRTGVTFDSRAVGRGDLFFALRGETHGRPRLRRGRPSRGAAAARRLARRAGRRRAIADARRRHADGAGRSRPRRPRGAAPRASPASPARSARPAPRTRCAPSSSAQAPTSASAASYNNHVGVPLSLARLPREARYGVFEIGMNHPGEIEPLARQVEAHVGVVTNVEAGAYRSSGQRGGDRRREGLPVRRHGAKAQSPCSIATIATSSGWSAMRATSASRASSASAATTPPRRG